jgi:hypothetical protein
MMLKLTPYMLNGVSVYWISIYWQQCWCYDGFVYRHNLTHSASTTFHKVKFCLMCFKPIIGRPWHTNFDCRVLGLPSLDECGSRQRMLTPRHQVPPMIAPGICSSPAFL